MPQEIRQKSGEIKVSLHAAVLEETYDKIEAAAKKLNFSMGKIIDGLVKKQLRKGD